MQSPALKILIIFAIFLASTSLCGFAQSKRTVSCKVNSSSGVSSVSAYLYEEVDEPPTFPGGDKAMFHHINTHRKYPAEAYANGIVGRVLCSFIVKANGEIDHVEVLKGVEKSLNDEAVRLIKEMPDWEPGKIDGESVDTYCILPISFRK